MPPRHHLPRLRRLGQLRRCHNDAHRTTSLPQRRSYRHRSCPAEQAVGAFARVLSEPLVTVQTMRVLHGVWALDALCLWAEDPSRPAAPPSSEQAVGAFARVLSEPLVTVQTMRVLHGVWALDALCLWAEDPSRPAAPP